MPSGRSRLVSWQVHSAEVVGLDPDGANVKGAPVSVVMISRSPTYEGMCMRSGSDAGLGLPAVASMRTELGTRATLFGWLVPRLLWFGRKQCAESFVGVCTALTPLPPLRTRLECGQHQVSHKLGLSFGLCYGGLDSKNLTQAHT